MRIIHSVILALICLCISCNSNSTYHSQSGENEIVSSDSVIGSQLDDIENSSHQIHINFIDESGNISLKSFNNEFTSGYGKTYTYTDSIFHNDHGKVYYNNSGKEIIEYIVWYYKDTSNPKNHTSSICSVIPNGALFTLYNTDYWFTAPPESITIATGSFGAKLEYMMKSGVAFEEDLDHYGLYLSSELEEFHQLYKKQRRN